MSVAGPRRHKLFRESRFARVSAVLIGCVFVLGACSSNADPNADSGSQQGSRGSRGAGTTVARNGKPTVTTLPANTPTLADDFIDDPGASTTIVAGTKPPAVDDDTYSDLVDEVVSTMADTTDNPCAVRAAYGEYLKLPNPDNEVQVERVFEGLFPLYAAIADTFPAEQANAAQAVRDFIDELESETSLADYSVETFLEFVPSDATESALQLFERSTNLC